MITINLLPPELRAKKESWLPYWVSLNVFSLPIVVLVVMLSIDVVLGILVMWQHAEIKMVTMKKDGLYPKRQEQIALEKKLDRYKEQIAQKSSYAHVFNVISDCMPQNAWFYKFSLDDSLNMLEMKGSFYDPDDSNSGVIGKFIACMKGKDIIKKTFKDISVKGLNQRDIKGTPVVDFSIYCEMKKK